MQIRIRHFDKIILALAEGEFAESDLVTFANYVNATSPSPSHVLLDLQRVSTTPALLEAVAKHKHPYERAKIQFLVVDRANGSELPTLIAALESLRTPESERIIEVLAQEAEISATRLECARLHGELSAKLGVDASAPGDLTRAIAALENRNRRLRRQFRTLIEAIGSPVAAPDTRSPRDPAAARVAEARSRVLDAAHAAGALD